MDREMGGQTISVTVWKAIVLKLYIFRGQLEEWMQTVIMYVRVDRLKDGRMKIKLTNIRIRK